MPDETLGIHRAIRRTGVLRIPEQVIHPVHIEIAVDNAGQGMFSFHYGTELTGVNFQVNELAADLILYNGFNIIMSPVQERFHERFTGMGERTMPNIMEKRCGNHQPALRIG